MSLHKHRFLFSLLALLLMHAGSFAQVWDTPLQTVNPLSGTGGSVGQFAKIVIVNGNPAMVSYDAQHGNLYYVRATDASGTTWGTPVEITTGNTTIGQYASIAVVNGNPAIAYNDFNNGDLNYIRANDANGTTWGTPVAVATAGNVGLYCSILVVNGNPAIAYYNITSADLYYVRATDASGTAWGTPVALATTGTVGLWTSLCIVNGNPAVSYYDQTSTDLNYIRATDANGTAWGTAVVVASSGVVGQYTSLCVVNGNPAISYYDASNTDLNYVRATDVSGTAWGTPVVAASSGSVGQYTSLCVVNGNPAIAYYDVSNADLNYVRASNANGTAFNAAVVVTGTGSVGQWTSMCIVNGNPAIAYWDAGNANLSYKRATDASGTTWSTVQSFDVLGFVGEYSSVKIVNGNPAIAYYDGFNGDLYYVRATDAAGTTWGTPVAVHTSFSNVGQYASLCIVNGNPAISYYDATGQDLYYVRANDVNGTSWGTPVAVYTSGNVGQVTTLLVVNGNPAISYYDQTNTDLYYVRATDASGTTWGMPVAAHATTDAVGTSSSMYIVNGNPAIAYFYSNNTDLYYVRATDANGSAWGTPVAAVASSNNVGSYTSMCVVNGNPAVSYYDGSSSDLYYVRATDANGTAWGTPVAAAAAGGNIGIWSSLCVVNGNPAISYYDVSGTTLYYVRATDAGGTAWNTSVTLDAIAGNSSTSMIVNGTDVFIAYFDNKGLPGFVRGNTFSWTGGASTTDWSTTGNWSTGTVPTATDNVGIPSGLSFYPNISTGTANCKDIIINSGGSVLVSGGTLQMAGNISNSGTLNGTGGTVILNGSQAQSIVAGTFNATNLTLNNSTGATINSGTVNILGTYTPTSGTLTTGGFLTLKSTASATARIAAGATGGGYISGNVTVERYIPGRRAFRFLAHPFSTAMNMNELTDDIDITGTGGIPFTTTANNNPSAFYFDVATGDNTTAGNNPGWTAFTASSSWAQYQPMRVLVRGAKGEGLNYPLVSYTPSATTIDMTGPVNQGNITIPLTKGSGTNFVLVTNPFPSQVAPDFATTSNVGSSFYVWNAQQGTRGGYTSYTFGSSAFSLPACGSFVTTLTANGSITFEESDKISIAPNTMFKTTAPKNTVELKLEDSTIFWDRFLLRFDDNAMATIDYPDAPKLYNPDMSFYTWSKDDSMLSIDARPYAEETIKLGLYSTLQKNFKIVAGDFDMPAGTKLYLKDKYLTVTEEITGTGYEYWFTTTGDTASWGNNRFELTTQGIPTNSIAKVNTNMLKVKLVPNPASDKLTVYTQGADGNCNVTITSMTGVKVGQVSGNDSIVIPLNNIASGIYMVTIENAGHTITQKLIKQ